MSFYSYSDIDRQFIDAIDKAGWGGAPSSIIADGYHKRFKLEGDKLSEVSGWYVVSSGALLITYGNWKTGEHRSFVANANNVHQYQVQDRVKIRELQEKNDIQKKNESLAILASLNDDLSKFPQSIDNHPYLIKKKVGGYGLFLKGNTLVIPLLDSSYSLATVQYIETSGEETTKRFHKGLSPSGSFFRFFSNDSSIIYVCEGYSTGASIFEATGKLVYSAMSAGNMVKVSEMVRKQFGAAQKIVVVADNDKSGAGQEYAGKAAKATAAEVVVVPIQGMDANDYVNAGHDLNTLLTPPARKKFILSAVDFIAKQSDFKWIIKNFIQEKGLAMCHGASGSGKTFIVLDMIMRMASGMPEWCGNRVKQGSVLYAAGEGHSGLKKRIVGWAQENKKDIPSGLYVTTGNCDLDTPDGFQMFVESIRELPDKPSLVVIDTLHRFLSGDENSAQDARIMIDSCNKIINEFSCAVLLVHHTGVSEEAQHRGRGSSAWRAALDNEFNILRDKEGRITISQKKSKDDDDSMQLFCDLRSIGLDDEFDDDGDPITTAVVDYIKASPLEGKNRDKKQDSKEVVSRKLFENAWLDSARLVVNERPYVSRDSMREYLQKVGYEARTIRNMLTVAYPDKLIGCLTLARMIETVNGGWIISDNILASRLLLQDNLK